ncbi:Histone transcription regulator 3 [Cryomyces antarcticus]|uniref:Histone transcription regulator 3 homolog n=1 Tax=Cryomyces antarcticus TaxID=329879 RepID=A0ABR0LSH5_9PEZI|nr:Histone transcription regulator 3 [Cryomyces antarcticus]
MAAEAAKHELTQQTFTKTMVIQVWKPEYERAGRHFVYTSDYLLFFVRILEQLRDRASLEALAKRVRRKPNEFHRHTTVWQTLCQSYVRLTGANRFSGGSETFLTVWKLPSSAKSTKISSLLAKAHSKSGPTMQRTSLPS